jgi:hypothetical protein
VSESPETTPLSAEDAALRLREQPDPLRAALRAIPRHTTPDGEETYIEWAAVRDLIGDDDGTATGGSVDDSESSIREVLRDIADDRWGNADEIVAMYDDAREIVAAHPVPDAEPLDMHPDAVYARQWVPAVPAATVPAGPEHALHFDPDCEECAYLARPTRETLGSPSTGDDRLRERLAAVVQKWSGHLSERMLDDLERAARATVPAGPGHCRCEDHLQAALTEGCRCADHVHDGLEAARPVPAAEPRDPWIVVTDDCEACGALVGAQHATNCADVEVPGPRAVVVAAHDTAP